MKHLVARHFFCLFPSVAFDRRDRKPYWFVMKSYDLQIFADYHQFYIWDAGTNPSAPEDWTDEDIARRAKVTPSVLVVCPERNYEVPVRLELHDVEPTYEAQDWDHIVECGLDVPTGDVEVEECTGGTKLSFKLEPGTYRARILYGGLNTLDDDITVGADRYLVTLWPGELMALRVVKQHPPR